MNALRRTLVAAALLALFAAATAQDDLSNHAKDLAWKNDLLKKRLELARGLGPAPQDPKVKKKSPGEGERDFYLVLDPNLGVLQLMLRNAVLREFKVLGLQVGIPEVMYKTRGPAGEWQGQIFSGGHLDPPREGDRVVVVAPKPTKEGAEVDAPVPPTPEEKYPVPSRYHIRYAESVSLEVRTGESDPDLGFLQRMGYRLGHWWDDAKAALGAGNADAIRVRLTLTADDAKSLYRAIPPETRLFVVPKTS